MCIRGWFRKVRCRKNCLFEGGPSMSSRLLCACVLLHQVDRPVGKLNQVRMRAISICQHREAELPIPIAEKKRCVTAHASAVRQITIAVTHVHPPSQTETGGIASPETVAPPIEVIVLSSQHLLESLLVDDSLSFE